MPTPSNAIDVTGTGAVSFNGTAFAGGTLSVPNGGTANTTFTAYSVITAGTTATGAFQNVSGVGTTGQVLISNGASALPTWQAVTASGAITAIAGDSGSATGATVTMNAHSNSGSSVTFTGSSSTVTLKVTDSLSNTIMGSASGNLTLTGNTNTGLGVQNLINLTSGSRNIAIGGIGLFNLLSGASNVAIGPQSLSNLTTGNYNLAFGDNAGVHSTSSETSNISINSSGNAGESNSLRIGEATGTGNQYINQAYICGIAGITVTSTAAVLINTSTNQLGTIISSERFKENIEDMGDDSSFIYKLRPVKFTYIENKENGTQTGLIAEEVLNIAPQLVCYDKDNLPCSVQYHQLPVILLNEIQKLKKEIELLKLK